MKETVILVHGYFRNSSDMRSLKNSFQEQDYDVISLNLNSTFGSVENCAQEMANKLPDILWQAEKIHFVGHSFGGLIIRHFLSQHNLPNLGRCVLIATPNAGSKLADIAMIVLGKLPVNPIKSLESLSSSTQYRNEILPPLNFPYPHIGVIAGNKGNLILGRLLSSENDGRVEVNAAKFENMKDFIILPYNHEEIHHQKQTFDLVLNFLKTGQF